MPTYKNTSSKMISQSGYIFPPDKSVKTNIYISDQNIQKISDDPPIKNIIYAGEFTDETVELPYTPHHINVICQAETDAVIYVADDTHGVVLKIGNIYTLSQNKWNQIGKITVEGTVNIIVERRC